MSGARKPASFRVEPEPREKAAEAQPDKPATPRRPRAVSEMAIVAPAEIDVFDEAEEALTEPPPPTPTRRRSRLGTVFLTAFGILISLTIGLWTERLIRDLFSRADWLGWAASALAIIAAAALGAILAREVMALARLRSVEKLRLRAINAYTRDDTREARAVIDQLAARAASRPETAAGRRTLAELRGDIIGGTDLIRLAETEILGPLDRRAQTLILDAAKRVSVVTAVSPRALVDLAYVLFESGRLIRRLAELYGGRPGTFGFVRLTRDVLAHLAVTGVIAAGDEFVHQIVGQGLAARLSAKLGEGVANGMMTARIGVAAMEAVRPLPFAAIRRPGMRDFLTALTNFARKKGADAAQK